MKAMVCTAYGAPDVLQQEVEKPIPKDREIRIKIYATTVNSGIAACGISQSSLYRIPMRLVLGLRKPRQPILGVELAGKSKRLAGMLRNSRQAIRSWHSGNAIRYVCPIYLHA